MTPARLRQLADDADARALARAEQGDIRGAAALSALAESYRQVASEQEGLLTGKRSVTIPDVSMTAEHREAISRGHGQSAPVRAAKRAGVAKSLRELAGKLGVSHSMLSQVINGVRPMPDDLAAKYQRLVGVPWKV